MKNAILICLILAFLLLILFRMKSSADPVIPPALPGPQNNQIYYFPGPGNACPPNYTMTSVPGRCKINSL